MRLLGDLVLLVGASFLLLGALGLVRMPDVYNRIQTGTKAVTLGALSVLLGIALIHPGWWAKLLCIGGFILLTNPVGSSTIARAVFIAGVRPWQVQSGGSSSDSPPTDARGGASPADGVGGRAGSRPPRGTTAGDAVSSKATCADTATAVAEGGGSS